MAPKRHQVSSNSRTGVPPIPSTTAQQSTPSKQPSSSSSSSAFASTSSSASKPSSSSSSQQSQSQSAQDVLQNLWSNYKKATPQRTKLLDVFLAFLLLVGGLQFLYCLIAGNYPFNAFLAGFSATVGQFVLTASLRIQTNPENEKEFASVSHERAFADFVLGSLILHFFCVNFIN